ncbi:hypothetical protein KDU33_25715, partial [Klebsiella pneumoniae]|nr:hypothetical protein [Klebsiella pneumoniae]MBV1993161.1 hypothetical protein [Klebsiella pneumoniae]
SAQIREILISESAWEEMTCLFAPSLVYCHQYLLGAYSNIRYQYKGYNHFDRTKECEDCPHRNNF